MADLELAYMPAVELAEQIRRREISPLEVIQNSLARIDEVNPKLNCFCFVYPEEALSKAQAAERALQSNKPVGPLHGVPIAIKDFTPTRGKRTTMGSHIREHWIPRDDAIVVERLLGAGAILVGKTTTPEFAASFWTRSPLWGVTRNPWNPERGPGGSSGGSAVAVATGCVPLAEGSDMGGSIRVPAAWCGLVGLKPSLGRIPFEILPSLFDRTCHFGPLARTVDDAALFLDVAQGPDERDIQALESTCELPIPVPDEVRGLRLAFSPDLGYCVVDSEVAANARAACDALRCLGAEVDEVAIALSQEVEAAGWIHWGAYYAALLGDELPRWRDRMDPQLVAIVEQGLATSAVELKRVEFVQSDLWAKLRPIFARYDALLCPTMPVPAPPIDGSEDDFGHVDTDGRYHGIELTSPFNFVSQCPALSVPTGFTLEGLPTAIQIVGRRFGDPDTLRIGAALEKALAWTECRPPI